MKPNWNKQETGRPVHCEKAEGLMHVSMSYKSGERAVKNGG